MDHQISPQKIINGCYCFFSLVKWNIDHACVRLLTHLDVTHFVRSIGHIGRHRRDLALFHQWYWLAILCRCPRLQSHHCSIFAPAFEFSTFLMVFWFIYLFVCSYIFIFFLLLRLDDRFPDFLLHFYYFSLFFLFTIQI